jgi:type IV secretion system protein VirB5
MKLKMPGGKGGAQPVQPTDNPYLNAQNVWLERYGHFIQQAYNWRLIAMLEAVALVVGVVGLIYVATQTKYVPYIVDVNQEGLPINVHLAEQAGPIDQRVVHAELANWVTDARSVVTDRIAEKANLKVVYDMVSDGSPARGFLDQYYPVGGHSPFDRAQKETDNINIDAILQISNQTYVVQWTETIRDLGGRVTATQHWEANISVAFTPPTSEQQIESNPIGLFITQLTWTQKS